MNNFVLTDKGAVIEITNTSTEEIYSSKEGFISPTLVSTGNVVEADIVPAFTIQIPSFVSYKVNSIAPGDSISFVVTKPDEVFYYVGLVDSKIKGITISVTPITDTTVLQDKTITPTTEEQVVTADDGYDGLGTVTVEAVTSSIDNNITAENIKKDVEILGVTGSYEGSGGDYNAQLETTDTEFNYVDNYLSLLTSIEIPDGITSIGKNAFQECTTLTSVTIPNSVTNIGDSAFQECEALTSVTIPNSVTDIGSDAFYYCEALTSVTIPNSVTSIGNSAFSDCYSLTSVDIGNLVTSIGHSAFQDCHSLTSVIIGNSVTIIGDYAFYKCSDLISVTIPNSVTNIGGSAFSNCSALSVIEFLPITPPVMDDGTAFINLDPNCTIYVPNGTLSAYTTAPNYPSSATYNYVERPAT